MERSDAAGSGAEAQAGNPALEADRQKDFRLGLVGPGIVVAATGIGAGDLVATLIAGSEYGYALLWAAVLGTLIKVSLAEATARWHLATGSTIFTGWRSLGIWTTFYFAIYVVIWGFVYGGTAMVSTALPLQALFGGERWYYGAALGVLTLAFVWFNKYRTFERVMSTLVLVMFVTVVGLAIYITPQIGDLAGGIVPALPEGSTIYTLGLIGGVGGTVTMAAYGFWVNQKGWRDSTWMRVMRWDNRVGYLITGLFVLAMLIVGAELLFTANIAIAEGDQGLLDLDEVLRERFGDFIGTAFLVGFFATAWSSMLGVWQGVSMMVTDFWRSHKGIDDQLEEHPERTTPFRLFAIWLTFPPMVLLFYDQPFGLVIAYGALGAFFMPFLAGTLLALLNGSRTPERWRSGWLSNGMLALAAILFAVLCVNEVLNLGA